MDCSLSVTFFTGLEGIACFMYPSSPTAFAVDEEDVEDDDES